jgi:Sulfatase
VNRRQLFLSTAKAALATAFAGLGFRKGTRAQTTGAPTAVEFPDSTLLPIPKPPFTGVIEPNLVDSTPGWPPTVAPPAGAPNVLLILIDDAGFGSNSVFGGIVPTPTLESLARHGLRYTQMHNTALCSPTRAALLTGRNHHAVGFGMVAEGATGYPGYDTITGPETAHVAMTLKENGYATAWFGKNHNVPIWEGPPPDRPIIGRSGRGTTISTASSAAIPASGSRATCSAI